MTGSTMAGAGGTLPGGGWAAHGWAAHGWAAHGWAAHGWAAHAWAAGAGGAGAAPHGGSLPVAALIAWLAAELLGLYMLRSWLASERAGDRRPAPAGLSPALIFGHAGLAFTGLVSWVVFVLTRSAVPAWAAIGLLAAAIGLGISTVTVWTPYPAGRPRGTSPRGTSPRGTGPGGTGPGQAADGVPPVLLGDEMLDRALASESLTSELVDDLLARMLAEPRPAPPRNRPWQLAPVIPVLHGMAALVTFLLAMLAAITA